VERVIHAMRERLSEELPLEELAAIARMSPFHFNRVFHRLTGIPPSQYLSALRLEEARRLLLTTRRSVTDICFAVGYSSLGTFTTRFTQLVGLAPRRLRRLGEAFVPASPRQLEKALARAASARGPAIAGRVHAARAAGGPIFIGLFERPIPQEWPLACTVLAAPGPFRLAAPPEGGRYFLFAVRLARAERPLDYLLGGGSIEEVGSAGPFAVAEGGSVGGADLRLRPPDPLDPPLLVTLPVLLARLGPPPAGEAAAAAAAAAG
jgi:AraC-like DNA-binding protein